MSAIYGFIIAFTVFFTAVWLSFENPMVMLDGKSFLIVFGGTLAASIIAFPVKRIGQLVKVTWKNIRGKYVQDYGLIAKEIGQLAEARVKGKKAFQTASKSVTYPFLKDAAEVLVWLSSDVSPEDLRETLEIRAGTHFDEYMKDADFFKTVARFPPAFGLMGTTLGMIALMQGLGASEDSLGMIGPAMAVALVTTLYGIAIANFFLVPISENLREMTLADERARKMVIEGIMKIQAGKPPEYIGEHVKSFILPHQRQPVGAL